MAKVHFLTLTHLQRSVLRPIFDRAVLRWDCALHDRGNQDECVARLKAYGCRVIVECEIYDRLWSVAREAGIKTILVQHGQFIAGKATPTHLPDVSIMTGGHYAEFMDRAYRNASLDGTVSAPGYIRAETCLDAARSEIEHDGLRYLYAMPVPGEYGTGGYLDWMPVLRKALPHLAVKPHPRSGDRYNQVIRQSGCIPINPRASIYRWLAGLDLLICGPSNLIFEAALLGVPCLLLNPQRSQYVNRYESVVRIMNEMDPEQLLHVPKPNIEAVEPFWTGPIRGGRDRVVRDCLMRIEQLMAASE